MKSIGLYLRRSWAIFFVISEFFRGKNFGCGFAALGKSVVKTSLYPNPYPLPSRSPE